ncbi:hypothetical protein EMPS_01323 [Entomortierella parvispora]|uniref:Uncharacterized protein n=1 Tax=Entomortierella parvispora TaxID=205924 RepID=A0A9P3LSP3_9FUNG|nr:hypothetical protein EMPS_01323 [Entomortierella parvispora]
MCGAIECIAWDGLVVVGIILLIIWILGMAGVVHIGDTAGLKHIFVVLAAIFIIAWIFTRCCCGGRRRAGRRGGAVV